MGRIIWPRKGYLCYTRRSGYKGIFKKGDRVVIHRASKLPGFLYVGISCIQYMMIYHTIYS